MDRLGIFATLPSIDAVPCETLDYSSHFEPEAHTRQSKDPLLKRQNEHTCSASNYEEHRGLDRNDLRNLRRIYKCPQPNQLLKSDRRGSPHDSKKGLGNEAAEKKGYRSPNHSLQQFRLELDPGTEQRTLSKARSHWAKLGGGKQKSIDTKKLIISALQEHDEFSLPNAARKRKEAIEEILNSETYRNLSNPMRSISWDVNSSLDRSTNAGSCLDPRRLHSLDSLIWQQPDAEFASWTTTNNIQTEHLVNTQALIKVRPSLYTKGSEDLLNSQDLMVKNPAAFSEDLAMQVEREYRTAAETAHRKLDCLRQSPNNPQQARDFLDSINTLKLERPFFIAPTIQKKNYDLQQDANKRRNNRFWDIETSIFAERRKENDSRGFYDAEKTLQKQFDLDWERIIAKSRFYRLVGREDAGVRRNDQGLHQEVQEIKEELNEKSEVLRASFIYYSMRNGPASKQQLSLQQWLAFAQECDILDAKSAGVKSADLVRMFVSTNFEEDSKTEESEANDDDALVRFEFLEIIIRASFGKYISSKQLNDSSDSVKKLLEDSIIPNLPPEARVDPNVFRQERFYNSQMEMEIRRNYLFLKGVFKLYKAKDKTKYFSIEHWISFLESSNLIGSHTGIEKPEAKLVFAWSQMAIIDELKKRHRAVSLMFSDFVEAVARLADLISPPTETEMMKALTLVDEDPPSSVVFEYYNKARTGEIEVTRRGSQGVLGTSTRSLHENFTLLMEYLVESLKQVWGGNSKDQLTERMKKLASKLSGGIELG